MFNLQITIDAIILAGGQSSRMGRDKALLEFDRVPLILRTYQVAQQCAERVFVVTPWIERYREILPETCRLIQEISLTEENSAGPLVGFSQGLSFVGAEWVLLIACDMPRLRAEVLQTAAIALETVSQEAIALLPHTDQGWEPLCGFYRSCCLASLQQFIDQGGRSFQRWLAQQSVAKLALADPTILFNCNTPEDLQQLSD